MKTRLIGFALVASTQLLCAQTQKGNGLIGGTAAINYSWIDRNDEQNKLSLWMPSLSLTAGRFVADNWLAGLSVSGNSFLLRSRVEQTVADGGRDGRTTIIAVSTTPFVRRYFSIGPAFAFVGGGLSVNTNGQHERTVRGSIGGPIITNRQVTNWSVNPFLEAGVNYFVSNRLAVQLSTAASSVPFTVSNLNLGLVYWTGPNQKTGQPAAQDNPQTNRGNWLVEGSFSATGNTESNTTNSSANTTYQLAPSVSYFISKNTLLGLSIPLTYSHSLGSSGWVVGFAPYYQHYWTATRLTPYTRLGVNYDVYGQNQTDDRTRTLGASATIGLAYMAGKRFILETSLLSASISRFQFSDTRSENAQWDTGLSAGLRGNFAVRYVLTRPR